MAFAALTYMASSALSDKAELSAAAEYSGDCRGKFLPAVRPALFYRTENNVIA
ncbi:MAG: hypothetical protein R3D62_00465 [Xanthobacteraceae bacterium]